MVAKEKVSINMNDIIAAGIAITVMIGVVISSTYILMWPIPDRNETLVGQMQGSLWTALGMLVTYYFGSNKQSDNKDDTISALATTVGKAEGKADQLAREQERPEGTRTRAADNIDITADTVEVVTRDD